MGRKDVTRSVISAGSGLEVKALGGMLFGEGTTPLLDRLHWGERAVARLLDALLWTPRDGKTERERVHYGALDVEDLGRVYEALLELEPGITTEPMCRLRRAKLEVVVPVAQGAAYRTGAAAGDHSGDIAGTSDQAGDDVGDGDGGDTDAGGGDDAGSDADADNDEPFDRRSKTDSGGKTKVQFIEEIPAGRFFLRVGLGRKASGSYYTPHPFVRFLVQETLGPQLAERSPKENPQPARILELKVLDPAMGSGHFLVEACRYLGEALYEACRLCDELAVQAEEKAEEVRDDAEREGLLTLAAELRQRVAALPDPEDELVAYLPSRVAEGEESGLSQKKAEALCRRLVAVHCLYGVDKNPLAVELAKLSLWLESYAEGLPLTFMNHRLIAGDSLTGPFFEHMLTFPRSGKKLDDMFAQGLTARLQATLAAALAHVRDLEATVGKDVADLEHKRAAKEKLDVALAPFKTLAAAWSGGVMLGNDGDDSAYQALAEAAAQGASTEDVLSARPRLREMVEVGREGVEFELVFPEMFHRQDEGQPGFHAVLGNPPWDSLVVSDREFGSQYHAGFLESRGDRTKAILDALFKSNAGLKTRYEAHRRAVSQECRLKEMLAYHHLGQIKKRGHSDEFQVFACRFFRLVTNRGLVGLLLPAAFYSGEPAAACREALLLRSEPIDLVGVSNSRRYFDTAPVAKFALVVSRRATPSDDHRFRAAFRVQDFSTFLSGAKSSVDYPLSVVRRATGHLYLVFEVEDQAALQLLECLHLATDGDTGVFLDSLGVRFVQEFNITTGDKSTIPLTGQERAKSWENIQCQTRKGVAVLAESKHFHAFDWHYCGSEMSKWESEPSRGVVLARFTTANPRLTSYRVAIRRTVGSIETNERSLVSAVLPPGVVVANSAVVERSPSDRPSASALALQGLLNSHCQDFSARLLVNANLNDYLLRSLPCPRISRISWVFLAHSSTRLTCSSSAYMTLWVDQFGDAWREPKPKHTWPVLEGDDARWAVRAAIDAVVADAYGLDRDQYAHILSTFTHRSYPKAPELCLAAFDELRAIGLEAFTRKHDPYWDIPLNENLPKPVIDLPVPGETKPARRELGPLFHGADRAADAIVEPTGGTDRRAAASLAGDGAYATIVRLLDDRGLITSADAQQATGLDAAGVRPHLKRLVEEGRAVTEGQRRGTKYRRTADA